MTSFVELGQTAEQAKPRLVKQELSDNPSAVELFSYAVCCIGQGLVLLTYFSLVVILPVVVSHGL